MIQSSFCQSGCDYGSDFGEVAHAPSGAVFDAIVENSEPNGQSELINFSVLARTRTQQNLLGNYESTVAPYVIDEGVNDDTRGRVCSPILQ